MKFYEANVADVLRLSQRDELFLGQAEEKLHSIFKLTGSRNYHKLNKSVPVLASLWYYFMTTLSNVQTLGEEYTGTIRVNSDNRIPSKTLQSLWLILHIGGEPLLDRLLNASKTKISKSSSLTSEAKDILLGCIDFFKKEKLTLKRIHTSLFYTDGTYYNISNRFTGIRYVRIYSVQRKLQSEVLLRQWMQDNSFSGSFRFLGNISLLYVLYNFVSKIFSYSSTHDHDQSLNSTSISKKGCVLCGENIKAASATPCGHIFCWDCIYDSLKYQKICPLCRENVNPSRIILLQNYV